MRYAWFGFIGIVLLGFTIQPGFAQPAIELESHSFDHGISYPNQQLKHDFIFWNKGDQPLEIVKVTTTCGCAAAILSATYILPSASGIVSVTVVTSMPRKKKESATLVTNDPIKPKVTVDVETDVRNLWTLTPKSSFLFTEVPYDTQQSAQLILKNVDSEPFKVKATSVKEPELSVEVGEPVPEGVPITVTLTSKQDKKVINDQILILTDHPKQPQVSIPVYGRIVGFIRFNRQRVFFGTVVSGDRKKLEITAELIGSDNPSDLEITEITADSNTVTGKLLGMRGDGQYRIELSYSAPYKPGYQTGTITFKTNQEKEPIAEIPFSALIRAK